MNERFGNEFAKILDRTYGHIKDHLIDPVVGGGGKEDDGGKAFNINHGKYSCMFMSYVGLISACEIISLYSTINTKCIEYGKQSGKQKNRFFVELTRIMVEIKEVLK
jgi:hypothetical protein